jgi:hypothetical protein
MKERELFGFYTRKTPCGHDEFVLGDCGRSIYLWCLVSHYGGTLSYKILKKQ